MTLCHAKVERSETVTELRSLFLAKFSPDLRFLDGFGTGYPLNMGFLWDLILCRDRGINLEL